MTHWGKRIVSGILAVSMLTGLSIPAYASTRKKIKSVRVDVQSHIKPEVRFGDEDIEINVGNGKYSFDYYEIENVGFEWYEDDIPEITIYLNADEGYYFSLSKASAVDLTGATYVKAAKENSSETLKLTVKLPPMTEQVGDLEEVTLSSAGYVYWDAPTNAGSYEMRFYRNGDAIGATEKITEDTMYSMQDIMNRPGIYSVKVRARNKIKPENKSDWVESNTVTLDASASNAIRQGVNMNRPKRGQWMYDNTGGWWYMYEDGSYPKNSWLQLKDEWYFFDENGYMKTGWVQWNGKEYYCKEGSGKLLTNTTTPDGYVLDEYGTKKTD